MQVKQVLGTKIIVRFTSESIESIYQGREITRDDGSKVRLFIATPAADDMERKAALTVQTAIVTHVSDAITDIKVGDIAIVNYDLFNCEENIIEDKKEDGTKTFWVEAITKYHDTNHTAFANQKSARDQKVHEKGDFEEISFLLGILRNEKLIARAPFVFIDHTSNERERVTGSGLIYTEKLNTFTRRILSVGESTSEKKKIYEGDQILVADHDIFEVKLFDKSIDCVYERDVIAKVVKGQKYPIPV